MSGTKIQFKGALSESGEFFNLLHFLKSFPAGLHSCVSEKTRTSRHVVGYCAMLAVGMIRCMIIVLQVYSGA